MIRAIESLACTLIRWTDFLPLLGLRLFLAPIMIVAGWSKFEQLSGTVKGFGALGIPYPEIMAPLAAGTELIGGVCLLIGLATRLVAVPLAITMVVAALTVHLSHGWFAIANTDTAHSPARVLALVGIPAAQESQKTAAENSERIKEIRQLVDAHPRAAWLKESGRTGIIQSGIEYAATYFLMLLVLVYFGGGRYFSLDYYIRGRRN